jgi:hypothetical protein
MSEKEMKKNSNLEVLGNFSNKSLEWQLSDQQLSALLILTDLTTQSKNTEAIQLQTTSNSPTLPVTPFPTQFNTSRRITSANVLMHLPQSNCSRAIAMGLLHSASGRCRFSCSLSKKEKQELSSEDAVL